MLTRAGASTSRGVLRRPHEPISHKLCFNVILQGHADAVRDEAIGHGFYDGAIATPFKRADERLLMGIIGERKNGHAVDGGELHPPSDRRAEEPQRGHVGLSSIQRTHGNVRHGLVTIGRFAATHQGQHRDESDGEEHRFVWHCHPLKPWSRIRKVA